jgi:hypothetical protein
MAAVAAPTEAALRALCAREHGNCFACRPVGQGGLGLGFAVHVLEAEVVGRGGRCAQAQAKFMAGGGPEAAADTVTERRSGDSG